MPIENEGEPTNWTLRFKNGRITILIYVESTSPIKTVKEELLETLRNTYPDGLPSSDPTTPGVQTIPESPDDVILAVLNDDIDISKGWTELIIPGEGLLSTVKAVGLRDGASVAFAFGQSSADDLEKPEGQFNVEFPSFEEDEEGMEQ